MISIRLLRIGRKHQPSYKIVAVDQRRAPKSGKFIEQLGFYNPITKEKSVNKERVEYWLSVGAQPSDTVHNLLVSEGVIKAKKKAVHSTKRKEKEEAVAQEKPAEAEILEKEVKEKTAEVPEEEPKEEKKEPARIATQSVAGGEKKKEVDKKD